MQNIFKTSCRWREKLIFIKTVARKNTSSKDIMCPHLYNSSYSKYILQKKHRSCTLRLFLFPNFDSFCLFNHVQLTHHLRRTKSFCRTMEIPLFSQNCFLSQFDTTRYCIIYCYKKEYENKWKCAIRWRRIIRNITSIIFLFYCTQFRILL